MPLRTFEHMSLEVELRVRDLAQIEQADIGVTTQYHQRQCVAGSAACKWEHSRLQELVDELCVERLLGLVMAGHQRQYLRFVTPRFQVDSSSVIGQGIALKRSHTTPRAFETAPP